MAVLKEKVIKPSSEVSPEVLNSKLVHTCGISISDLNPSPRETAVLETLFSKTVRPNVAIRHGDPLLDLKIAGGFCALSGGALSPAVGTAWHETAGHGLANLLFTGHHGDVWIGKSDPDLFQLLLSFPMNTAGQYHDSNVSYTETTASVLSGALADANALGARGDAMELANRTITSAFPSDLFSVWKFLGYQGRTYSSVQCTPMNGSLDSAVSTCVQQTSDEKIFNALNLFYAAGTMAEFAAAIGLGYCASRAMRSDRYANWVAGGYLAGLSFQFGARSVVYPLLSNPANGGDWAKLAQAGVDCTLVSGLFGAAYSGFALSQYLHARKRVGMAERRSLVIELFDAGKITPPERARATAAFQKKDAVQKTVRSIVRKAPESCEISDAFREYAFGRLMEDTNRYHDHLAAYFSVELEPETAFRKERDGARDRVGEFLAFIRAERKPSGRARAELTVKDSRGNTFGIDKDANLAFIVSSDGDRIAYRPDGSVDYTFCNGLRTYHDTAGRPQRVERYTGKLVSAKSFEYPTALLTSAALSASFQPLKRGFDCGVIPRKVVDSAVERIAAISAGLPAITTDEGKPVETAPFRMILALASRCASEGDGIRAHELARLTEKYLDDEGILSFLAYAKQKGLPECTAQPISTRGGKALVSLASFYEKQHHGKRGTQRVLNEEHSLTWFLSLDALRHARAGDDKTAACLIGALTALDADTAFRTSFEAYKKDLIARQSVTKKATQAVFNGFFKRGVGEHPYAVGVCDPDDSTCDAES